MNRSSLFVAFAVVLCMAGTALWWAYAGNTPQPTIPVAKAAVKPAPPSAPAPSPTPQPTVAATPLPTPGPPQTAPQKFLTAETIRGTKWKSDMVDFNFLPDGRWQMGNRICAKWNVEGGRVRVHSDSGEEHFFDIQGEYLAFEGQKLTRLP